MRLIDVDALPLGRVEWEDIVNLPTVNIVQCRDCVYGQPYQTQYADNKIEYNTFGWCEYIHHVTDGKGFCVLGVNKHEVD